MFFLFFPVGFKGKLSLDIYFSRGLKQILAILTLCSNLVDLDYVAKTKQGSLKDTFLQPFETWLFPPK